MAGQLQEVDYQQMEADNLGEDWDCLGNFFDICDSFIMFGWFFVNYEFKTKIQWPILLLL